MTGRLLKIISNVLFVILGIILLLAIYSFISINILNNKYVNFFNYTFFQVASDSMAPVITTNDLIIVKLTKEIKEDDIITFVKDDSLITHRVISKDSNSYLTKGDANNEFDDRVVEDNVVGKVVKILPNAGVWFKVITTPKVIVLICITLFLFSLAFSYQGKKKLSKNDDFGIYYSGIKLKESDKND